jgi:hypothetical protein
VLEAQGSKTRVQIKTGKGFYGRLGKKDWSIPIYQLMIKNLAPPTIMQSHQTSGEMHARRLAPSEKKTAVLLRSQAGTIAYKGRDPSGSFRPHDLPLP